MGKFKVVNPVIAGTIKTSFDAQLPTNAAKEFWETLTSEGKYISGNLPKFLFTMMDTDTNKLHHFLVNEVAGKNYADFTIDEYKVKLSKDEETSFLTHSNDAEKNSLKLMAESNANQSGGKKKYYDDSSSSDSNSDDLDDLFNSIRIRRYNRPINYWWYSPLIYKTPNIFTPTFVAPLSPYMQLWIGV